MLGIFEGIFLLCAGLIFGALAVLVCQEPLNYDYLEELIQQEEADAEEDRAEFVKRELRREARKNGKSC